MTIYNALPRKEYERVFMCKTAKEVWHTLIITHQCNSQVKNCKIDLFTQEYEKFSISNEETIDSGFTRFNAIVTSLKSLDPDYSSKNHYEMVLDTDGIAFQGLLRKGSLLALKAKVIIEQTSDDSDSQEGSDKDINEEEAEAFNLLARNFRKGNRLGRGIQFGNGGNRFGKGRSNNFEDKVNQQTHMAKFPQIYSSLAVLVLKQGDGPIDAINKMMSFLYMFNPLAGDKTFMLCSSELEEEEKLARQREEDANIAEWDNVQAMMDADYELAARLQAEEQGELTIEEKSRLFVELMNKRKKHFARLRAEEQRRKPPTKAQKRNTMSTYLKNMAGYKHNQLKTKSFEDIQMLFDKEMKRVNTFVDMDTELVKGSETRTEGSSKRAGEELESENLKKQKLDENVEAEVDDDQEEAEMKKHMEIVPDDENIDREDLETLWKLVKAKHGLTRPEEAYERVLWGDLKVMFEPDVESEIQPWITYVILDFVQNSPRKNDFGCKLFLWKDERVRLLDGSPGASTPPSYSPGPSTPPSYSLTPSRNAECSNCKLLIGKIKVLEATLKMYIHPENHTLDSIALLYELQNDMGKFGLE
ncbi:hypothetical protein Tco_1201249 [Tanacetum coccineum]